MILIADSGSTKTDWCVVREGRPVRRFETDGTNPFFQAPEQIERTLVSQLLPRLIRKTKCSSFPKRSD